MKVQPSGDDDEDQTQHRPGTLGDYGGCGGNNIHPWGTPTYGGRHPYWDAGANGSIISHKMFGRVSMRTIPFRWDRHHVRFATITDGLSNTIFVGEKHIRNGHIGKLPDDASVYNGDHYNSLGRAAGINMPLARGPDDQVCCDNFGSWHPGVCQFTFGDGSVRTLQVFIASATLEALAVRNDGAVH